MLFKEIGLNDLNHLKGIYQNKDIMKYALHDAFSDHEILKYMERILENNSKRENSTLYEYQVFVQGAFIGLANIEVIRKTPVGGSGDIGYFLLPEYWHKGYGTEICKELIRICFEDLHFHKAIALCHENNIGSWKVMEKSGMRREGKFINHRYKHGKFVNELQYGILNPRYLEYSQRMA